MTNFEDILPFIRQNEVGRRAYIDTPYGRRLLCYADLTATGRYLHFVEAWVRRLRPYYANTHTAISSTGRIMTRLREEARQVIARSVKAAAEDVVLFTGAGATAAVNKLVAMLGLRLVEPGDRNQRPVVLVGPYEHHSNVLPWLESAADVVEVELGPAGGIDLEDLRRKLEAHADRPLKIGAFSAASNVTGLLTDVRAVARTLHRAGAVAVFDYAAAAPYVPIDMHPPDPEERIDALVLSTHKFVGGPQASGVLVTARSLCRTRVPERPGGGTVEWVGGVSHADVVYASALEEREEGGTPAIVGDIRAGVAFLVKEMIGPDAVLTHETVLATRALDRLARNPRIRLLGSTTAPRLAILSFNIEGLHHDLVSVLLDHLFGIQNRAGCACAGPYGHRLLGIDQAQSERLRQEVARGIVAIKPGWVRLTLPFYASEEDVEFLLGAVEFVAEHGDAFIAAYRLGWRDGVWCHIAQPVPDVEVLELTVEALTEATQTFSVGDLESPLSEQQLRSERARYFREAAATAAELRARAATDPPRFNPPSGHPALDELVWFKYVHAAD